MGQTSDFDPNLLISHKFPEVCFLLLHFIPDVILYALGVGACARDAVDENELKYVYHEDGAATYPGFTNVCCLICCRIIRFSASRFRKLMLVLMPILTRYDPRLLLHGQQYIEIHKSFPSSGCVQNKASISGLHDKGKAAIVEIEIESYEKESGELLCKNRMTTYLRGAGSFSRSSEPYSYSKYPNQPVSAVKVPKSQPFVVFEDCTQPSQALNFYAVMQALLYRLSGDYNPLHSDPGVAKIAGFSRPILHGLCTLGFAVRAIIRCICRGDPNMVKNVQARFLLHVYPGETLITEMWLQGLRVVYQTKVKERSRTVLSGYVDLSRLASSL
ncbi:Enoyl-CoA hydratase 2, peroxisomal [Vitis vinifera]|uniref:Enoyl-CoA hydratase 2, peroxisomal n=1 Tax=Vitis vinifera TaxID=29760 RepID=A0A438K3T6_VITVI|nr:Enoyl-CoA hydratase 2, peroxisomal [Vitis vinifera]